jgi:glycosyltransferase involved in cell wall biosynthesis
MPRTAKVFLCVTLAALRLCVRAFSRPRHNLPVPKRFTFLVPYFPPDVAADGQLFALLAREFVRRGHAVRVLTWKPRYQGVAPRRGEDGGLRVSRWWAPGGKSLIARAFGAFWLYRTGFLRALFSRGTIIVPSSPPGLALAAWWLSWLGRRYIYVLHDIHPDLGIALGKLRPGLIASCIRWLNRRAMARACAVATLTEGMKERALALMPRANVAVIPNWVDLEAITPAKRALATGVASQVVIQYSGNMGILHPLEGLTRAVGAMPDCELHFIGRGARLATTRELVQREKFTNVKFFDYRSLDKLGESLADCDIAAIALEPGADKLAMPSKLQGILASGRPVLCLAPATSELARFIERARVGVVVNEPNDLAQVRAAIEKLRNAVAHNEMSNRAREVAEAQFGVANAASAYEKL